MKLQKELQLALITDSARARISLVLPVLKGVLLSLQHARVTRLGGYDKISLADLAREYREGSGDCGICFEYAVHDSIRGQDKNIYDRVSEVLENFIGIKSGAESILFGAEKSGGLSLIETSADLITTDSRILSGKIGQPAKLKKQWDTIKKALRDTKARDRLPVSIKGLWKADLFIGSSTTGHWVGSTLKLNKSAFEGAAGLRLGIYPETKKGEAPSRDEPNNLILCPIPYDASFMELFYTAFFIVKSFLTADARVPKAVSLPNAADRLVAQLLEDRRDFTVLDVIEALYSFGQVDMTAESVIGAADVEEQVPMDAVAPVPISR